MIPGLTIINDVITSDQEIELIRIIDDLQTDGSTIRNKIKTRTTMHYGYVFSAALLRVDFDDHVPDIPDRIRHIINNIFIKFYPELSDWEYDQITINRYEKGGGIAAHVDTHSSFDENVVIISLESPVVMRFNNDDEKEDFWILPRSLLIMTDQARYLYMHKIPTRNTDSLSDGEIIARSNRTSITIRKVRKDGICDCKYPKRCDYQNPTSFHTPDRL